jgi:hypothetical protein
MKKFLSSITVRADDPIEARAKIVNNHHVAELIDIVDVHEMEDVLHKMQDIAETLKERGWQLASNIIYDLVEELGNKSGL